MIMELIAAGSGFTIAQLCVMMNALLWIFWLRNSFPGIRPANFVLAGVVIANIGGYLLGNLKS
jgi:glucose uptake protein